MMKIKFKKILEYIKLMIWCFFPFIKRNEVALYNFRFEKNLSTKSKEKIEKGESFADYNYRMIKEIERYHRLNNTKNILNGKKDYYDMKIFKTAQSVENFNNSNAGTIINMAYTFIGICIPFIIMYYQILINSLQNKIDLNLNKFITNGMYSLEDISKYYSDVTKIVECVGQELTILPLLMFGMAIIFIGYIQAIYKRNIEISLAYYKNSLLVLNNLKSNRIN